MVRRIFQLLMLNICFTGAAASPPALANVMYHHLLDASSDAYVRALVLEKRVLEKRVLKESVREKREGEQAVPDGNRLRQELQLVRAGLAFNMSLTDLGRSILSGIDQSAIQHPDQLYLFLASQSHEQQDWSALGTALTRISQTSTLQDQPQMHFLNAELASHNGKFDLATAHLAQIPSRHPLRYYAEYNLGVLTYQADKADVATGHFKSLLKRSVDSAELTALQDRGRLALSTIEIEQGSPVQTRVLTRINADGPDGPAAVGLLASHALQQGDYRHAARLWRLLLANDPWHPQVRGLHAALPYAIEQSDGTQTALRLYQNSLAQLTARIDLLNSRLRSDDVNSIDLANAIVNRRTDATVTGQGIKHLSRIMWDNDSRQVAHRLLRLTEARHKLAGRQQNLDLLLDVDREQQTRITRNAKQLLEEDHQGRLDDVSRSIDHMNEGLESLLHSGAATDLTRMATTEELQTLRSLQDLKTQAQRLNSDASTLKRIRRLNGLVMFNIANELPARVRRHQVRIEQQLDQIASARARIVRIRTTAENLGSVATVSGRIRTLDARIDQIMQQTDAAIAYSADQLQDYLHADIRAEIAELSPQVTHIQLALARIKDDQLLARKATP